MTRRLLVAAALTVASLCGAPAVAQSLLLAPPQPAEGAPAEIGPQEGGGPERLLLLPGDETRDPMAGTMGTDPNRGRTAADIEQAASGDADTVLVPMRVRKRQLMTEPVVEFVGEWTQESFVFVLPRKPARAIELSLVHQSSVNALPESSSIGIEVNGTPLRDIQIRNFAGYGTDRFLIDASHLRSGENIVRITVRQTHRIFCGVQASFQLWTRLDLARSGLSVPGEAFRPSLDGFVAALAAHAARGEPVPVRHEFDSAIAQRIEPLFSVLREALGGNILLLEEQSPWQIRTAPSLKARIALVDDPAVRGASFERGGDGAQVLVVGADVSFAELADAIAQLLPPRPSDPWITELTPGQAHALGDIATGPLQGHGRYIAMPVSFRLPNDWMLLANQKAQLDLDYRFAPALPEGALLQVKINGKTIRLLPLDRDGGRALPTLPIRMPTNMLRAGHNVLLFEALVPGAPSDAPCPVLSTPVLEVLGTSRLYVPPSPRMSVLDLDHALSALDASAVFLTDAAYQTLGPGTQTVLASVFGAGADRDAARPGMPKITVGLASDIGMVAPYYSDAALRALTNVMRAVPPPRSGGDGEPNPWDGIAGRTSEGTVVATMGLLRSQLETGFLSFSGETYTSTAELPSWLQARSADAVLLQPDAGRPEHLWLFIEPSTDLKALAENLANRLYVIDGPRGQIALYSEGDGWENWSTTARILYLLEPITPGNFLAVAGNFATAFPWIFVFLLIFIAVSASLVTAVLVLNRRRENP